MDLRPGSYWLAEQEDWIDLYHRWLGMRTYQAPIGLAMQWYEYVVHRMSRDQKFAHIYDLHQIRERFLYRIVLGRD